MKALLAIASAGEALMGLGLVVQPPLVTNLLFGAEAVGETVVVARLAGMSLVGLGVACWSRRSNARQPLVGMTLYSALVTTYLLALGIGDEWVGPLLWPAVALHVVLTLLLAWSLLARAGGAQGS